MWKPIKNYEGLYQINENGAVKGLKRGKLLCPLCDRGGYLSYILTSDGIPKRHLAHRLVAESFVENPDHKEIVHHIDGNKKNNNSKNLKWVTKKENVKHAWEDGRMENSRTRIGNLNRGRFGEDNKRSKLTDDIVKNIRENKYGLTTGEFAGLLEICTRLVLQVKKRERWGHVI